MFKFTRECYCVDENQLCNIVLMFLGHEQREGQARVQHSVGVLTAATHVGVRVPQRAGGADGAAPEVRAPAGARSHQKGGSLTYISILESTQINCTGHHKLLSRVMFSTLNKR